MSSPVFNKVLALIPARGGSKGIPRKNIQVLAGKPLVAYTIENALHTPSVTRVVVSTDDAEIAAVAQAYGAEVISRPSEMSGDTASSESALIHALQYLKQIERYEPDLIVFLQCTSPLTLPEDIEGTIKVLVTGDADSAMAVTRFRGFLWGYSEDGNVVGINHSKHYRALRQEMKPQFLETGAVYVMRTTGFIRFRHRFFGRTVMYIMPPDRCIEIDEPSDLVVAETLLCQRKTHGHLGE